MFVDSIILENYRAYKGHNKVAFKQSDKNIFLISGNNGFGKTTFLTSLVWCMYGKLMVDVDEKFRKEINDIGGYKAYAKSNLNKELVALISSEDESIQKKKYKEGDPLLLENSEYSVQVSITDVFIPSVPCRSIVIKRAYNYITEQETTTVLIDGHINELAKEVGFDIFINDFILSKDIAKFFFFDAEKIVNLADFNSSEERKKLSSAYSEVLGIKKYEEIKKNLENLRIRFRKNAGSSVSQNKLTKLESDIEEIEKQIEQYNLDRSSADGHLLDVRSKIQILSERLIREGNALSIEELSKLKDLCNVLREKDAKLKSAFRDMLDIAPFAISGRLLIDLKEQADREKITKSNLATLNEINNTLVLVQEEILCITDISSNSFITSAIENIFREHLVSPDCIIPQDSFKSLLDFSPSEENEFQALYDNIRLSFGVTFKQLVKDIKNNNLFLIKTQKKITQAESDDSNAEINLIRSQKAQLEKELLDIENESRKLSELLGVKSKELSVKKKQLSELAKLIKVDDNDKQKDQISERLISEISQFLQLLKQKRSKSLSLKIKHEIDVLMHKSNFIHDVRIDLDSDIIDIVLLDYNGKQISKDKLSKGEQQLYATAILKSLVDESGISFPVFIDSPLQKFDRIHSHNIITKFYPSVSKQVIIFPLLGKELSLEEYLEMKPNINGIYIINNADGHSTLQAVEPDSLFN